MTDPNAPENEAPANQAPENEAPGVTAGEQPAPEQPPAPYQQPGVYPQQPGPYQQPGAPGGVPPRNGFRPWMWWLIGGGAAFIVIVVVAIVLVAVAVTSGNGAKNTAQDFLNSLAKGDANTANKLARIDTSDDDNALLRQSVLAKAEHISDPRVVRTASSSSSDLTYAYVQYRLDGKSYRTTLEVDKDSHGWFIADGATRPLPYVDYSVPMYSLKGSGLEITSKDTELVAYPGVYTVVAPNDLFTVSGDTAMRVAPDSNELNGLKVTPSQKYVDQVQKAVNAHLDECAKSTDVDDAYDCGIQLSYPENLSYSGLTVAITVVEYPKVTLAEEGSVYDVDIEGGSFSATATGTDYSGNPGTENLTGELGYLSAGLSVEDGKVEVDFR